jgi:hypothetical protein
MRKYTLQAIAALTVCLSVAQAVADQASDLGAQTRPVASRLVTELSAALRDAALAHGPVGSIVVCRDIAPALAGTLSREHGWRVSRVSLRTRNPLLGSPDAWEQGVLLDFDRRAAAGEPATALEHAEIVDEPAGRYFRYMQAVPVGPLCAGCHGPKETMAEELRAELERQYPHDLAIGYAPGQVRGAVTIKRPLR